ncbi:glutaminase [uncultured Brevundimonas sp.]|uniref:glutaminase n=1 Tax=uncultured Brevundimonas sp. TaxID=213418 RepID=UPI0030EBF427|tara:strand:- start:14486 stop:15433 length:948 start_codon:yes stop_codon:yes gene_type:complete
MHDLSAIVADITEEMQAAPDRGRPAGYIPALARADVSQFGMAIVTADGSVHTGGSADAPFSLQSVTKVFALTQALGRVGDQLWDRVGREPSGSAFNSIVQLESEHGIPRNPFINAGAIVVADVNLARGAPGAALAELLNFVRYLADDDTIAVDTEVAASEQETGFRNVALANYMKSFGNLRRSPEEVLDLYFSQCAIAMSCRQLAMAGRYLMAAGLNPTSGHRVVPEARARRINALMLTCGHYDASGDFAFRVGLPGKSGVGGGILAVAPGRAAIAVWSPGLNAQGNSQLGTLALERLATRTGWSVFDRGAIPDS